METDFLVIGSGISGLNFALNAAKKGKVLIVTKKKVVDTNTNYAQGGIAAVLSKSDEVEKHIEDTMKAGGYHNDEAAVRFMVEHSADAIYHLIDLGVHFDKENGRLKLGKEGGHGMRRIAHVGDYTGKEIERILVKRIKEHPNITVLENTFALELLVKNKICYGLQVILKKKIINISANQTIITTGGIGQLYSSTTNPRVSTGDGIAMGIRAGCKTKDLEFIQFHPTAFAKKLFPRFLISEAVRGEGAVIINEDGERVMKGKHPQEDLAPRDIVAREIYKEMEKGGKSFIDIRKKSKKYLQNRFPQIYQKLQTHGYKMEKDLIPITPAAHYICGGIKVNRNGKTGIKNLFAFGEVTCTGVHGANRLASNSLLEALVFSNQITLKLNSKSNPKSPKFSSQKFESLKSEKTKDARKLRLQIQKLMWKYAGIVREPGEIKERAIPHLEKIIKKLKKTKTTNQQIAETINMAEVGLGILKSAAKRKNSLGCHFLRGA
jgi:L-aspartate oxidase